MFGFGERRNSIINRWVDWLLLAIDTLNFTITIHKKVNLFDTCHPMIINCHSRRHRKQHNVYGWQSFFLLERDCCATRQAGDLKLLSKRPQLDKFLIRREIIIISELIILLKPTSWKVNESLIECATNDYGHFECFTQVSRTRFDYLSIKFMHNSSEQQYRKRNQVQKA